MIYTSRYTIGHIARTGGDATKALVHAVASIDAIESVNIPYYFGNEKHQAFSGHEKGLRVLNIRRLPAYILSIRVHQSVYTHKPAWSAEDCCTLCNGDSELKRMTNDFNIRVDRWLRCEHLRDDINKLFTEIYKDKFTTQHKAVLYSAVTKAKIPYDHNVYNFFSNKQLKRLYNEHLKWAELEHRLYGSILA